MLCDLQCRSSQRSSNHIQISHQPSTSTTWWTTLFLYIMHLQLQTSYQTTLLAIWTLSPSRMARLMQLSMARSTSPSTTSSTPTPLPSPSTLALAQRNAATGRRVDARWGALALQRRSVLEARRMSVRRAAATERHQQIVTNTMALQEQHGKIKLENEDRDRDNDGVGR